jgi:hypothetical protein
MAKVFGVHTIELRPGADEQEFKKLIREQLFPAGARLGWKGYILKGDRGERVGKYAVIWEIQSMEQRDRFYPALDQPTEEAKRLLGSMLDEFDKRSDLYVADWRMTDYIEQGE